MNQEDKPNRLIREKSPYLIQHTYKLVNWYPWDEKEEKISFGKGAEILGMNKIDLITYLGKMGRPYSNYEEIEDDLTLGII